MRLFKRNKSPTHHPVRSAEQLVPALAPHPDPVDDRRYSQFEYQAPSQPSQPHLPSQSLSRSQSQRQSKSRDRPTVNVVPDERHDKGLSVRPSSSILERSISVRGKTISNPISQPASPRVSHPETLNEIDEFSHSYSENPSPVTAQSFEPRSASLAYQHQQTPQRGPRPSHPAHTPDNERSQLKPVKPPLHTHPLPSRTNDALEQYARPSPTDIPESPYHETHRGFTPQDPVMTTRPPSQLEPLSPVQTRYPDAVQSQGQAQAQFQSDKPPAGSPQQDRSRPGSVSNMPENGLNTPTHRREDSGEINVQALIQKHDELRTSYPLPLC